MTKIQVLNVYDAENLVEYMFANGCHVVCDPVHPCILWIDAADMSVIDAYGVNINVL